MAWLKKSARATIPFAQEISKARLNEHMELRLEHEV